MFARCRAEGANVGRRRGAFGRAELSSPLALVVAFGCAFGRHMGQAKALRLARRRRRFVAGRARPAAPVRARRLAASAFHVDLVSFALALATAAIGIRR